MECNNPAVVAELLAIFERYEAALVTNDIDTLDELFWRDPRTVRVGVDDRQDGFDAIRAFRRAQHRQTPPRTLANTSVLTFGTHTAIVTTDFIPVDGSPPGRQSQTWVRLPEGWRVAAAHVSYPASWKGQVTDTGP